MSSLAQSLATSLADTLATSLGNKIVLPFSAGVHSRAIEAYLLARPSVTSDYEMTGPFTSNVLATRNIRGRVYGLFEDEYSTINNYAKVLPSDYTNKTNVDWDVTPVTGPLGSATAYKLKETGTAGYHYCYAASNPVVNGDSYVFMFAAKRAERNVRLSAGGAIIKSIYLDIDMTDLSVFGQANIDWYELLEMDDDWVIFVAGITSDANGNANIVMGLLNDAGAASYAGTLGYGAYFCMSNFIEADYFVNYIDAASSPLLKPADVFYYPSASVPSWMKDKFTLHFIPNYDFPGQISQNKTLWAYGSSYCILSPSGTITVIEGGTKVQASSVTCSMHDECSIEFDRVNGTMTLAGFTTGNGLKTGTAWTAPAGNFYYGCNTSGTNQACALLAQPEG